MFLCHFSNSLTNHLKDHSASPVRNAFRNAFGTMVWYNLERKTCGGEMVSRALCALSFTNNTERTGATDESRSGGRTEAKDASRRARKRNAQRKPLAPLVGGGCSNSLRGSH